VDSSGNLYVADTGNQLIRRVTSRNNLGALAGLSGSTGSTDGSNTSAKFDGPQGIAVVGTYLYVADTANHLIRRITPGGVVTTFAGSGTAGFLNHDTDAKLAQFNNPSGVAVDRTGNLYVADLKNHRIRKITPGGEVTTLAGTADSSGSADGEGTAATFDGPQGI